MKQKYAVGHGGPAHGRYGNYNDIGKHKLEVECILAASSTSEEEAA